LRGWNKCSQQSSRAYAKFSEGQYFEPQYKRNNKAKGNKTFALIIAFPVRISALNVLRSSSAAGGRWMYRAPTRRGIHHSLRPTLQYGLRRGSPPALPSSPVLRNTHALAAGAPFNSQLERSYFAPFACVRFASCVPGWPPGTQAQRVVMAPPFASVGLRFPRRGKQRPRQ
jgi:hypothetical protein